MRTRDFLIYFTTFFSFNIVLKHALLSSYSDSFVFLLIQTRKKKTSKCQIPFGALSTLFALQKFHFLNVKYEHSCYKITTTHENCVQNGIFFVCTLFFIRISCFLFISCSFIFFFCILCPLSVSVHKCYCDISFHIFFHNNLNVKKSITMKRNTTNKTRSKLPTIKKKYWMLNAWS